MALPLTTKSRMRGIIWLIEGTAHVCVCDGSEMKTEPKHFALHDRYSENGLKSGLKHTSDTEGLELVATTDFEPVFYYT